MTTFSSLSHTSRYVKSFPHEGIIQKVGMSRIKTKISWLLLNTCRKRLELKKNVNCHTFVQLFVEIMKDNYYICRIAIF